MNIVVKSPLMAEQIKTLLDGNEFKSVRYAFMDKKGMEMTFGVSGDGIESLDVVAITKSVIKSTPFGKGIFFSVVQQ